MEAHPTPSQADEIEAEGRFTPSPVPDLEARLRTAAGVQAERIDWTAVFRAADKRQGFPVRVTR